MGKPSRTRISIVAATIVATLALPRLPLFIERTMTRSNVIGGWGDTITWGWKATSLVAYVSDYRYMRPEEQPMLWLCVDVALLGAYVALVALSIRWVMIRASRQ
jgi:hypothetical protein